MPSLRFYVTTDLTPRGGGAGGSGGLVELDEEESRHARKVMRIAPGDAVELFDGRGVVAAGKVVDAGRTVAIEVTARQEVPPLALRIDLAVALPKGDRAAVLIEKASELGADRLIPLITERSIVDPREGKLERLRRIAIESAKQCGRAWLMEIAEPIPLEQLLRDSDHDLKLIADRVTGSESAQPRLDQVGEAGTSRTHPKPHGTVLVIVGPEGGWTEAERRAATEAGFHPWRLGPHILRIETAALAAVAILRRDA